MESYKQSIRVTVFAHNEEALIAAALGSVLAEAAGWSVPRVYVLVNGSTDRTLSIVRNLAAEYPQIIPLELAIGDKCNAWNHYVHDLADDASVHFFMDGDMRCGPGALRNMYDALLEDSRAKAIAGVPLSGRNRQEYTAHLKERHWLYGNLYAVKGEHLAGIRELNIRLPLGLFGNDNLIGRIMRSKLDRLPAEDSAQIIHRDGAGYMFDSLQPYHVRDWRIYLNRHIRYRWRWLQLERLDALPLAALPSTMDAINHEILAELHGKRLLKPLDWAVRRRLEWRYPTPESVFYERLLDCAPTITSCANSMTHSSAEIAEQAT